MNTLEFFWGRWRWGVPTHVEWWVEGRGMRANSFGWEFVLYIKTHFYGEHSLHISWRSTHLLHLYFPFSWWRHQMKHVPRHWLFCGEFTGDCGEFTGHQWIPLTQTSDAELWWFLWTNGWVSNQDAGDLRRHRAHYDVTVMLCRVVMGWGGWGGDGGVWVCVCVCGGGGGRFLHVSHLTTIIQPICIFVCKGSAVCVSKMIRPK